MRLTMKLRNLLAVLAVTASAVAPVAIAATHKKPPVKAPKSGSYSGFNAQNRDVLLYVGNGKSLDLAGFAFKCGKTSGRTNLNSVPLKKTRKGYSFSIRAHGSVDYADDQPSENGTVDISGRFDRTGRRARGHLHADTPRCPDTGRVSWSVKRDK
jgi:hypothetical protein